MAHIGLEMAGAAQPDGVDVPGGVPSAGPGGGGGGVNGAGVNPRSNLAGMGSSGHRASAYSGSPPAPAPTSRRSLGVMNTLGQPRSVGRAARVQRKDCGRDLRSRVSHVFCPAVI